MDVAKFIAKEKISILLYPAFLKEMGMRFCPCLIASKSFFCGTNCLPEQFMIRRSTIKIKQMKLTSCNLLEFKNGLMNGP